MLSKVNLLVIISILINVLICEARVVQREKFINWQKQYNKKYNSLEENEIRFEIFKENADIVEHLNAQKNGARFALNKFADLSTEEFRETILMPPRKVPEIDPSFYVPVSEIVTDLPTSFDWRDKGAVTAVKNQGSAGTCWAFSTTGNIEGQWFLTGNNLTSFSEEQIVECDTHDCGVFGGWPYRAYEYVMEVGGLEMETAYPYCCGGGKDTCYPCMADKNRTFCGPPPSYCNVTCHSKSSAFVGKISNWTAISKNETEIAVQLMAIGPLSVLIDASTLEFYDGGVWDPLFCSNTALDHAVLIVGFGVEDGIFENTPFWTVKNSWGKDWGNSGYFNIIRGDGKCGINTMVTSSVIKN